MEKSVYSELVDGLIKALGGKLASIILYGSFARGTNTDESDVDIALIVNGRLEHEDEDKMSDFIVDMNLKYNKVFSVIDIDLEHFNRWVGVLPFYKNVEQEGVVLWKAA